MVPNESEQQLVAEEESKLNEDVIENLESNLTENTATSNDESLKNNDFINEGLTITKSDGSPAELWNPDTETGDYYLDFSVPGGGFWCEVYSDDLTIFGGSHESKVNCIISVNPDPDDGWGSVTQLTLKDLYVTSSLINLELNMLENKDFNLQITAECEIYNTNNESVDTIYCINVLAKTHNTVCNISGGQNSKLFKNSQYSIGVSCFGHLGGVASLFFNNLNLNIDIGYANAINIQQLVGQEPIDFKIKENSNINIASKTEEKNDFGLIQCTGGNMHIIDSTSVSLISSKNRDNNVMHVGNNLFINNSGKIEIINEGIGANIFCSSNLNIDSGDIEIVSKSNNNTSVLQSTIACIGDVKIGEDACVFAKGTSSPALFSMNGKMEIISRNIYLTGNLTDEVRAINGLGAIVSPAPFNITLGKGIHMYGSKTQNDTVENTNKPVISSQDSSSYLYTWYVQENENASDFAKTIIFTDKHITKPVEGKEPTYTEPGYKSCFQCVECNEYFEDEAGTIPIDNYDAWIDVGGRGYLAPWPDQFNEYKEQVKAMCDALLQSGDPDSIA